MLYMAAEGIGWAGIVFWLLTHPAVALLSIPTVSTLIVVTLWGLQRAGVTKFFGLEFARKQKSLSAAEPDASQLLE